MNLSHNTDETVPRRRFYAFTFFASWCLMYLVYPTWVLPLAVWQRGVVFACLLGFIGCSAFLFYRWLAPFDFNQPPRPAASKLWFPKETAIFAAVATVAVALHLYPIGMPITQGFDEAEHLHGGLAFYIKFHRMWYQYLPNVPLQLVVWGATLLAGGLIYYQRYALSRFLKNLPQHRLWQSGWIFWGMILGVVLSLGVYFGVARSLLYHGALVRFPPLGKVFYALVYLFSGPTPVGPRLLQAVFYVAGAGLLWHLVARYRDSAHAHAAAVIYLFSPLVFYQARVAELACGTIFFQLLLSFLFLRFYENRRATDLIWLVFWFVVAFLFKRTNLFMLGVMGLFLLPGWLKADGQTRWALFLVMLIGLFGVLPFLVIGKYFTWRNYVPEWSNLTTLSGWTVFLKLMPKQMSWAYFGAWVLAAPYLIVFRRDRLSRYMGLYFLVFYTLYTLDHYNTTHRFAMSYYPFIAVAVSHLVVDVGRKLAGRRGIAICTTIAGIYLAAICTVWPAAPMINRYVAYHQSQEHFFRIDRAMQWLKRNISPPQKVLMLGLTGSAFYRDINNIDKSLLMAFSNNFSEVETPRMLAEYCRTHQITHLIFGLGPDHEELVDTPILNYLKQNPDETYQELIRFMQGQNGIYIYQVSQP